MERVKQLNSVLSKLDEDGLIDKFQKIKSELHEIVQGKINSVLYDVASSGKSKENPTVEKMHLPFSVGLGGFDEEQVEMVLQELKVEFPDLKQEHNILTKSLLPEALKRIAKEVLNLNNKEIEWYMKSAALGEWMSELEQKKMKGNTKKRKLKQTKDQKKCKKIKDSDVVFISREKIKDEEKLKKLNRPNFQRTLSTKDKEIILGNGVLDDRHVMIIQNAHHKKFPFIEGLYSTTIGTVGQFKPVTSEFVQVLHDGIFHWVCVSNIACRNSNTVKLYDSLYAKVAKHTKDQISNLLNCHDRDNIFIEVQPVQQQTNGVDCGVYALAFATALCFGKDPCEILLNRRTARKHLWWCLENENLAMFPHSSRQSSPGLLVTIKVPIYCSCRRSNTSGNMVECDGCSKWYHQDCENIPNKFFRKALLKTWVCSSCNKLGFV